MTTKYHKTFGQVEVISSNDKFTTIVIVSTGEQKTLANQYVTLTDAPATKVKKVKEVQRELTAEEKAHIEYLNATGQGFSSIVRDSNKSYRKQITSLS